MGEAKRRKQNAARNWKKFAEKRVPELRQRIQEWGKELASASDDEDWGWHWEVENRLKADRSELERLITQTPAWWCWG